MRECGRGAGPRLLHSVSVRATLGMCMWVKLGWRLVRAIRVRMGIVPDTDAWLRVGLREVVKSRSRSWSMMSAEVLIRLSLYLSCGLRVQAGARRQ